MVWQRFSFDDATQTIYFADGPSETTTGGSVTTAYAATWDGTLGTDGWATLDGGITTGYAHGMLFVSATRIYLYGNFSVLGSATTLSPGYDFNVARWDGTKWNFLGTAGTTNGRVREVAYDADGDLLYAVGDFTTIYGTAANRVAAFDGSSWSALGTGANSTVQSCCLDGDQRLYITGSFGSVGGVANTVRIARWTGAVWQSLCTSISGTGYMVRHDAANDAVYLSGNMSNVNAVASTDLLARYDVAGDAWSSVGDFSDGDDTMIYAIAIASDGTLYVGGEFVSNGTDVAARATDGTWTDLGADPYTLDPTQSNFQPIHLTVDGSGNVCTTRNAGGDYILKAGDTTWTRIDALASALYAPDIVLSSSVATVAETGTTDTFTVALAAGPDDTIVLSVTSADTAEVTVSPATLTFTAGNFSVPQTVTVTGVNDSVVDGVTATAVTVAVDTDASTGTDYDAVASRAVSVSNTNTTAAAAPTVSVATLALSEDGDAETFTVLLSAGPAAAEVVVLDVASSDTSVATVAPATLTFTSGNYNAAQTVTVTPVSARGPRAGPTARSTATVTLTVNQAATTADEFDGLTIDPIAISWTAAAASAESNPICFAEPERCMVMLANGREVPITALRPGARVLLADGTGAAVDSVRYEVKRHEPLVTLARNLLGYRHARLEVTREHLVLMQRHRQHLVVPAPRVPGAGVNRADRVRTAHIVLRDGRHGLVMVNGVWAETADVRGCPEARRATLLGRQPIKALLGK